MRRTAIVLALLALGLNAGAASASLVKTFSLPGLFRAADNVVVGLVVESTSFWNDAHDTIYTHHTIKVERVIKGTHIDQLVVRQMGGIVGETRLSIAGNASLAQDERVLLVLRDNGGFHTLVGMAQGKWSVRELDGVDHAVRGPAAAQPDRLDGELPLSKLLQKLDGTSAGEEEGR